MRPRDLLEKLCLEYGDELGRSIWFRVFLTCSRTNNYSNFEWNKVQRQTRCMMVGWSLRAEGHIK